MTSTYTLDHIYNKKAKHQITSSVLRLIAMISMLIDHVGLIIIKNGILYGYDELTFETAITTDVGNKWYILYVVCRMIGRISFPIFCFLLVEAVLRTKNIVLYLVRLFLLALVSEIPFNLMCSACVLNSDKQSVIITLFLSAITILILENTREFSISQLIVIVVSCVAAYFSRCDYGVLGIILCVMIYYLRMERKYRAIFITVFMFAVTFKFYGDGLQLYGAGALAGPIIYFYNGKLGYEWTPRTFNYLFYPIHIALLFLIVYLNYPR